MTSTSGKPVIYESPDGGRTVWARVMGELSRHKVSKNDTDHYYDRIDKWRSILQLAQDDPELNRYIEQVEVLYELRKPR